MGGEKEDYNLISIKNRNSVKPDLSRKISDDNKDLFDKIDEIRNIINNETNSPTINNSLEKNSSLKNIDLLKELHQEKNRKIDQIHKSVNETKHHHLTNDKRADSLSRKVSDYEKTISDLKKVIISQKSEVEEVTHSNKKNELDNSETKGYYKTKLLGLTKDINDQKKALKDVKSVVMQQKEEIEDKDKLLHQLQTELEARKAMHHPEKIQKALKEKHDMIVNVHNITKELSDHYLSKVSEYKSAVTGTKKINQELIRNLENSKLKNNKVVISIRDELEHNHKVLREFKKLTKDLDAEVKKREDVIKGLYEDNQTLNRELADTKSKADMYERISLKSKNDSFTYQEKFEEVYDQLQKNKGESKGLSLLVPKLTAEITQIKKQMNVLNAEYEERIERIKGKHEEELQEFFSTQTKSEMTLKTQIYSLNQDIQQLELKLTGEKEKQQLIAGELNDKLRSLMNSDDPIITNVPKTINDDY